jgi:hypothetical protein
MINIIKKAKGIKVMSLSFQEIVTKIVIGSAIPVALAFTSFLYDLKIGQEKLILLQLQSQEKQEALQSNQKSLQSDITFLKLEVQQLKIKQETFVTQIELRDMIKRFELFFEKSSPDQKNLEMMQKKLNLEAQNYDNKIKKQ